MVNFIELGTFLLPSHCELAFCVVCGFISDLSGKHCSATCTFGYLHCRHG